MKCIAGRVDRSVQKSHPARGAWIEIGRVSCDRATTRVAPRTGCVD